MLLQLKHKLLHQAGGTAGAAKCAAGTLRASGSTLNINYCCSQQHMKQHRQQRYFNSLNSMLLYNRKKYLKDKAKARQETFTISDVLQALRIYSFSQHEGTAAVKDGPGKGLVYDDTSSSSDATSSSSDEKSENRGGVETFPPPQKPVKFEVQFQFVEDCLKSALHITTTLPFPVFEDEAAKVASRRKILLFTNSPETAKAGLKLGATYAGGEELFEDVLSGKLQFEACVSTKDIFPKVITLARYLGPRGLMPSPAKGTVSDDIKELLSSMAATTSLDSDPEVLTIITSPIGYSDWNDAKLEANIKEMFNAIVKGKPGRVESTKYLDSVVVFAPHTPGFLLPKRAFRIPKS